MIVGIHQPNYFPGLSYFTKILYSDLFIFLSSVQFSKGNWTNRNRIMSSQGELFITAPVLTKGQSNQSILDVRFNNTTDWRKKHYRTVCQNYSKAPYFKLYKGLIEKLIHYDTEFLSEFNMYSIKKICANIGIKTQFVTDTDLGYTKLRSTELLVHLVEEVGGAAYLSGAGGMKYMNTNKFSTAGLELLYLIFSPVTYRQCYSDFIANLSIIDLLMNEGAKSLRILKESAKVRG